MWVRLSQRKVGGSEFFWIMDHAGNTEVPHEQEISDTPRRKPPRRILYSFPRSPWECRPPRSACSAKTLGRGSVHDGVFTQSVGTR